MKEPAMTFCPDCGKNIASDLFVAHREMEHPPTPRTLTLAGIKSQETVYGQTKE